LNDVRDLRLQQDTPVRVIHRRAPLIRQRVCTPPLVECNETVPVPMFALYCFRLHTCCFALLCTDPSGPWLLYRTSEMALTAAVLVQAIHSIKCELMSNAQWFALDIVAEAGTYIKEFCHGDFGRTQPNVGSLLGKLEVQIAELDVVHISLDSFSL
jgi:tRNA U54 and U55 pseudouridine synthase Pus10